MAAHSSSASPILEEGIAPQADSLFILGHLLADYNAKGLFVADLSQSATFSQALGKWTIHSQDLLPSPILVANAGKQFSNLDSILATPFKIALLGAYTHHTRLLIDPLVPNFTQTLLENYFPGIALIPPSTNLPAFDPTQNLLSLGYEVSFSREQAELLSAPLAGPAGELSNQEILVTALLLLLLEIDIRPWIQVGEKALAQREVFRILGTILRKDHLKEARFTGLLPRLFGIKSPQDRLEDLLSGQPVWAQQLLGLMSVYIENPVQEKNIGERTVLLQSMRKVFTISDTVVEEEKRRFLETFCEGLFSLARKAEKDGNLYESVNLAQSAQMVTQWLSAGWEGASSCLHRIAVRECQMGWRTMSLPQIKSIDLFMSICAYVNSASLTDMLYFKHSMEGFKKGKNTNLLWSSLMRAIDRERWVLHLMDEFRTSPLWSKDIEEPFGVIFSRTIKQFGQLLYLHLTAAQLTFEKEITSSIAQCYLTPEGQEAFLLKKELEQTNLLVEALSKEGLSEHIFNLFKELLQISSVEEPPLQADVQDAEQQLKEFNELLTRFHAKEENLVERFAGLLTSAQDARIGQYCALMILLLATQEKQWDTALVMITYLHDTIESAWDLPGIPIRYYGNYFGEELLQIDPILDALRILSTHLPEQPVINNLLDRYLERYVAE